jgi:general secretion pathway protein J
MKAWLSQGTEGMGREAEVALRATPRSRSGLRHRLDRGATGIRGFTLIEIILATLLLSLGLTIAFASLHSTNASVQRSEAAAARNEHLRAVQSLLYRVLQSAQPVVLARDDTTQQVTWLEGKKDSVRFVAPMPGYMSRGGPYVITLQLVPSGTGSGTRLQFAFAMLVDEKPLENDGKLPPEDLLDGIADAHFEYRGLGQDGKIGEWQTEWSRPSQLPLQIRVALRFSDPTRPWPPFATALPLGFAQARADDAAGPVQPVHVQPVQAGNP